MKELAEVVNFVSQYFKMDFRTCQLTEHLYLLFDLMFVLGCML
jgi:hypothetical protein